MKIGDKFYFFDDGKTGSCRVFEATVRMFIPIEESKNIILDASELWECKASLYDIYVKNIEANPYKRPMSPDMKYFVVCSIPKYDDNLIYFYIDDCNEWWSLDVQSDWQGGILDVDRKIFNKQCELWGHNPYDLEIPENE